MAERTTYRGYTLSRERFGHVNVWTEQGFVGGYPTMAEAQRTVDERVDRPLYIRLPSIVIRGRRRENVYMPVTPAPIDTGREHGPHLPTSEQAAA